MLYYWSRTRKKLSRNAVPTIGCALACSINLGDDMDESELIPFRYLTKGEQADALYCFGGSFQEWEITSARYHRRIDDTGLVTIDLVESATDH